MSTIGQSLPYIYQYPNGATVSLSSMALGDLPAGLFPLDMNGELPSDWDPSKPFSQVAYSPNGQDYNIYELQPGFTNNLYQYCNPYAPFGYGRVMMSVYPKTEQIVNYEQVEVGKNPVYKTEEYTDYVEKQVEEHYTDYRDVTKTGTKTETQYVDQQEAYTDYKDVTKTGYKTETQYEDKQEAYTAYRDITKTGYKTETQYESKQEAYTDYRDVTKTGTRTVYKDTYTPFSLEVSSELDGVNDTGILGELMNQGTDKLSSLAPSMFQNAENFRVANLFAEDNKVSSQKAILYDEGDHNGDCDLECHEEMYVAGDPVVGGLNNGFQPLTVKPGLGYFTMLEDGNQSNGPSILVNSRTQDIDGDPNNNKGTAFTQYGFKIKDQAGKTTTAQLIGGECKIVKPDGSVEVLKQGETHIVGDPNDPIAKFYYAQRPGGKNGTTEPRLVVEYNERLSDAGVQELVQKGVSEADARALRSKTELNFGFRYPDGGDTYRFSGGFGENGAKTSTPDGVLSYYDMHIIRPDCQTLDGVKHTQTPCEETYTYTEKEPYTAYRTIQVPKEVQVPYTYTEKEPYTAYRTIQVPKEVQVPYTYTEKEPYTAYRTIQVPKEVQVPYTYTEKEPYDAVRTKTVQEPVTKTRQIIDRYDPIYENRPVYSTETKYCYYVNTSSPLVLDLDGNGVNPQGTQQIDVNADGTVDTISSFPNDGLMVFDANKNGTVGESGLELLGNASDVDGDGRPDDFANGFDALRALSIKHLGSASVQDNTLSLDELKQLESMTGLGLIKGGSFVKASDAGVQSISLDYNSDNIQTDADGNLHGEQANFTLLNSDGTTATNKVVDVWFNPQPGDGSSGIESDVAVEELFYNPTNASGSNNAPSPVATYFMNNFFHRPVFVAPPIQAPIQPPIQPYAPNFNPGFNQGFNPALNPAYNFAPSYVPAAPVMPTSFPVSPQPVNAWNPYVQNIQSGYGQNTSGMSGFSPVAFFQNLQMVVMQFLQSWFSGMMNWMR